MKHTRVIEIVIKARPGTSEDECQVDGVRLAMKKRCKVTVRHMDSVTHIDYRKIMRLINKGQQ